MENDPIANTEMKMPLLTVILLRGENILESCLQLAILASAINEETNTPAV